MTEQEAIKNINALNAVCMNKEFYDVDFYLALKLAVGAIEKVQIIEAIGTVEEFKALKEKSEPKKVLGLSISYEGKVGNCPCCYKFVAIHKEKHYCSCGQKLDWE